MAAAVQVRGLREVQSAFRKVDKDIPNKMKGELLSIAQEVRNDIRAKVPTFSGRSQNEGKGKWKRSSPGAARESVKARASQRGAAIAFGGETAPYFPWLDFGGSTGKGHRPNRPWSGSVVREWQGRPFGDGRYVYPTIAEKHDDISNAVGDAAVKVAKSAGFEVR